MKALVVTQPGEAEVRSIPGLGPRKGEVFLKVKKVGLCGSDLNSFRGKNPLVTFPRVLGHEVAATILAGVKEEPHLREGMDVTLLPYTACGRCASCFRGRPNACQFNETLGVQRDGGMTEYLSVLPEKVYPAKLSLHELCLVEPLAVGFHAVARGRVTRDDVVAVIGCGGVGLGAVTASKLCGARTIGIDVDDEKLKVAVAAGATDTINTSRQDLHQQLSEFTAGRGPDVVIEAIGLADTFRAAVEEVAFTGRVVYIGYAKAPVAYETKLFVQKELDILGSRNALPKDFHDVIHMLESGVFPTEQVISSAISLEQVPEALIAWSNNFAAVKKIIVSLD